VEQKTKIRVRDSSSNFPQSFTQGGVKFYLRSQHFFPLILGLFKPAVRRLGRVGPLLRVVVVTLVLHLSQLLELPQTLPKISTHSVKDGFGLMPERAATSKASHGSIDEAQHLTKKKRFHTWSAS
jgi:hypothetical protein